METPNWCSVPDLPRLGTRAGHVPSTPAASNHPKQAPRDKPYQFPPRGLS
jgi:hypothetical protein